MEKMPKPWGPKLTLWTHVVGNMMRLAIEGILLFRLLMHR